MQNNNSKNYFLSLTPGKLMGLRQVCDEAGKFKVLALDQSNSFRKALTKMHALKGETVTPEAQEILETKLQMVKALSGEASAVLLDVGNGLAQALYGSQLSRNSALIARLEASDDAGKPARNETGWSVAQIKQMGCSAVKLLLYMDCDDKEFTDAQIAYLKKVHSEAKKHDILLMVEELTFARADEDIQSAQFKTRKATNIINATKLIGPYCDILKLEYPGEDRLEELNEAAIRPWVLLSAGQPYDQFRIQVQTAMSAGASGIMAGRAIFNDYFTLSDEQAREQFLATTAIERLRELGGLVDKHATSWQARNGLTPENMQSALAADWYAKGVTGNELKGEGDY